MNELHLFAGAGGGILGGMLCGHTCICAVEINPYCRAVLLQRQRDGLLPRFPIWDDVTTFDGRPWRGKADMLCGGFPCQEISSAGNGDGLDGERSGLWREMARITEEVRPRYVLVENSPMLTLRGLGVVLGDLAEMGYDTRWGVLGARHAAAPHKRDRIWILANASSQWPDTRQDEGKINPQEQCAWWASASSYGATITHRDCRGEIPGYIGMDDGMADWMDRLAAIGNGQVPAVVRLAWETLTMRQNGRRELPPPTNQGDSNAI